MTKNFIFFNHSFEKKRLKALISWIHKTFGEKEALRVVDELKVTGFTNATRAGLSIGLHDLITPPEKPLLLSKAQVAMNKTDQDFKGGKITATERSQRIIDTWHRTSDTLRKQVVDHFNTYDQLNSVYIMALSGARGNFSQVRQLIGMRGLMADPQGQIISFPIRSNFREGLTLTEYFISCSGARKGLVDTALRTADTGYLTRRLVDVSHQVVIKRVACNTSRGIVLKPLQTGPVGGSNKIMLSLKDRLIGRVLAEDIKLPNVVFERGKPETTLFGPAGPTGRRPASTAPLTDRPFTRPARTLANQGPPPYLLSEAAATPKAEQQRQGPDWQEYEQSYKLATRDTEISPSLAFKIACLRDRVVVRSSLTCACTHEVCQLCYGWSLSQGKLVSLGEAVGVIAAQSIGEPGTQLTMRTFHTGGVFSGDLLQDIRAPHAGKVFFPQALQGLLVRTAQGQIAFLIKIPGSILLDDGKTQVTHIQLEAATMVFVRQGEVIESNTVIGELAVITKEGNQPIKSRQTLFAEFGGRVTHHLGKTLKVHKPETEDEPLSAAIGWYDGKELDLVKDTEEGRDRLKNGFRFIEPTHSLSLGVFRILATRIGAKESHLSKVRFTEPKLRFSKPYQQADTAPARAPLLALRSGARAKQSMSLKRSKSYVWPTVLQGKSVLGDSTTTGCFATVPGELNSLSFALANYSVNKVGLRPCKPSACSGPTHPKLSSANLRLAADQCTASKIGSASVNAPSCSAFCPANRSTNTSTGKRSYVLNTIAEEGDLVDENYKDCTSSFL